MEREDRLAHAPPNRRHVQAASLPVLHEEGVDEEPWTAVRRDGHLILGHQAEAEVLEHRHDVGEDEGLAGEVQAQGGGWRFGAVGDRVVEHHLHQALAGDGGE